MQRIAALATLAALIVPALASAQGPATIRGVAYICANHLPMTSARVTLHRLDDDTFVRLTTDSHGRFTRVGLEPGRYLVSVDGGPAYALHTRVTSRLARLETDDVLDMSIGGDPRFLDGAQGPPADQSHPQPLCDSASVPPAPTTADRYIIH